VRAIARSIQGKPDVPLVIDPVIGSTSGTLFLDGAGVRALMGELLPLATLVTPNWPEAESLSGIRLHSFTDAERAARAIVDGCGCAVLVKGGHAPGNVCRDCLVTADGHVHWFESTRSVTPNTHGTGCVLASAIATELAKGRSLERAVATGRAFLQKSLRAHRAVGWGGAGPAYPGR
jgi:hydroxymethylpyrimidine/phosphomethylpyrimidine kinase